VRQTLGFLIILACALAGAALFCMLGFVVWGQLAEWLWGPFTGHPKARVDSALRAGPGGLVGLLVGLAIGSLLGYRSVRRFL
jgi:hypothetical protein